MPRRGTALEHLDDDHATAAAWTTRLGLVDGGSGGLAVRFCNGEQLTRAGDVVGARAAGEQAIVAGGGGAVREDVGQEAAGEIAGWEGHELFAVAATRAV